MTFEVPQRPLKDRTLGEIAASLPGATGVLRAYKLDYCCGGTMTLAEAARKEGIDSADIEEALTVRGEGDSAPAPKATADLIDHILGRYHETHRRELPELVRLARKVEEVHAAHPQKPAGLADTLAGMIGALEVHMKKEELILFPLMRQGATPEIGAPISQMRHEHDDHAVYLRRLEQMTHGFDLPAEACASWTALYAGLEKLVTDLMEHIHLENNVLFPRFEAR